MQWDTEKGERHERLERWFHRLKFRPYAITSTNDPAYNCLAWAIGRNNVNLTYSPVKGVHLPDEFPRSVDSIEAWSAIIEAFGFEQCENGDHEPNTEKVALWLGSDGTAAHAARQRDDGNWMSKLGSWEDIIHRDLDAVDSQSYGTAVKFFKRPFDSTL